MWTQLIALVDENPIGDQSVRLETHLLELRQKLLRMRSITYPGDSPSGIRANDQIVLHTLIEDILK